MLTQWRILSAVFLLVFWHSPLSCEQANQAPATDNLAACDQLYRAGKFAEAESSYKALIKSDAKLVPAQVGLVLSMLRQQKIDEALDSVNTALASQPQSGALLAAKGDVQFRRGEMSDAETSYLAAKKLDPNELRAYLGLARLYRASSMYRTAYDLLQQAHEIAPNEIEVQRAWLPMLPRKERLAALEAYLAAPHPDDEGTRWMQEQLEFLKATVDKPIHACRLVSKVEQTETKLDPMYANDLKLDTAVQIGGIGLGVKLNGHNTHLLLDTGAGGILVSRRVAARAKLTRISSEHIAGLGDQGLQDGYTAVADRIRIGELEFSDCVVTVSDRRSVANEDGLVGADFFGAYLVDIDLAGMRLKLKPLPKRPDDALAAASLNSVREVQATAEQKQAITTEPAAERQKSSTPALKPEKHLPRDRYIAPEMYNWTKAFRFGHILLVPTIVNASHSLMFVLDTGAFDNALSLRAGRQISKPESKDRVQVSGLNGEVKKVYSSEKATLRFGHLPWESFNAVTFDLSTLSSRAGTEVSGFLGFTMLQFLDIKIDYRDGLVNLEYPNPYAISN